MLFLGETFEVIEGVVEGVLIHVMDLTIFRYGPVSSFPNLLMERTNPQLSVVCCGRVVSSMTDLLGVRIPSELDPVELDNVCGVSGFIYSHTKTVSPSTNVSSLLNVLFSGLYTGWLRVPRSVCPRFVVISTSSTAMPVA
jgi:hypothetical protein